MQPTTRKAFDDKFSITIKWSVQDRKTGAWFLWNKTTEEPLENILEKTGSYPGGKGSMTWEFVQKLCDKDHLGSWFTLGGNGNDREVPDEQ